MNKKIEIGDKVIIYHDTSDPQSQTTFGTIIKIPDLTDNLWVIEEFGALKKIKCFMNFGYMELHSKKKDGQEWNME